MTKSSSFAPGVPMHFTSHQELSSCRVEAEHWTYGIQSLYAGPAAALRLVYLPLCIRMSTCRVFRMYGKHASDGMASSQLGFQARHIARVHHRQSMLLRQHKHILIRSTNQPSFAAAWCGTMQHQEVCSCRQRCFYCCQDS